MKSSFEYNHVIIIISHTDFPSVDVFKDYSCLKITMTTKSESARLILVILFYVFFYSFISPESIVSVYSRSFFSFHLFFADRFHLFITHPTRICQSLLYKIFSEYSIEIYSLRLDIWTICSLIRKIWTKWSFVNLESELFHVFQYCFHSTIYFTRLVCIFHSPKKYSSFLMSISFINYTGK